MKKQFTNDSNDSGFKHNDPMKKMGHTNTGSEKKPCDNSSKSTTHCKGCSSTKCEGKNCSPCKPGMSQHNSCNDSGKKSTNGHNKY